MWKLFMKIESPNCSKALFTVFALEGMLEIMGFFDMNLESDS